jgi:hypothetical protein
MVAVMDTKREYSCQINLPIAKVAFVSSCSRTGVLCTQQIGDDEESTAQPRMFNMKTEGKGTRFEKTQGSANWRNEQQKRNKKAQRLAG